MATTTAVKIRNEVLDDIINSPRTKLYEYSNELVEITIEKLEEKSFRRFNLVVYNINTDESTGWLNITLETLQMLLRFILNDIYDTSDIDPKHKNECPL